MAEDEVGETLDEAKQAHTEKAEDPGATTGQAMEPEVEGHADQNVGAGEGQESEIPVGVDALTDEQIAKAEEAGPAGGGDGDDGALDVSALMEEGGADDAGDAEPTPDDDTSGADAATEEEA